MRRSKTRTLGSSRSMRRAWRIIFLMGLVLLLAPSVAVGLLEQREWVADGVYGAMVYAGIVLVAAWTLGELVFHFLPTKAVGLVILLEAIPLVAVPSLYINAAAFFGRPAADFNT